MGSITGKHQGDERNEAGLHIRSAEEKKKGSNNKFFARKLFAGNNRIDGENCFPGHQGANSFSCKFY